MKKNGLTLHITKKHKKLYQLDGNTSFLEDDSLEEDLEYSNTEHYWKTGWLGCSYQAYLDAMKVVDDSDLDANEKAIEREEILCARKKAFGSGDTYLYYPPWKS